SPAEIRTDPARSDYWLQIPIREHFEVAVARECIACGPERAAVSSPTRGLLIRTKGSGDRFNVSLNAAALNKVLAGLLNAEPNEPLEFAPAMDLAAGYGRSLAQYVRLAAMDFDRAGSMSWDANTVGRFEELIMCRMLLSHPNNYTELLQRRERWIT